MDWLSSLSPDSSDEEPVPSSEVTIKAKSGSESPDKVKNKVDSSSGSLAGEDSAEKSKDNSPETRSDDKNILKNTDKSNKSELGAEKTDDSAGSSDQPPSSLFSIASTTRKIDKYNNIVIKSQELTESEIRELAGPPSASTKAAQSPQLGRRTHAGRPVRSDHSLQSSQFSQSSDPDHALQAASSSEYVEKVDFNEALHSFNRSNLNMERLTNQWVESNLNIKEIKADDLLAGSEKERLTRNPLIADDRKKFSLTTRLMETEDGQVITTNVARRTQKRKHQINWLAMEAQDKEMEILERTAHMRKSKRETQMKYGW